jgi:hypothetical protein
MSVGGDAIYDSNKNNKVWLKKQIKALIETNNTTGAVTRTRDSEFSGLNVPV